MQIMDFWYQYIYKKRNRNKKNIILIMETILLQKKQIFCYEDVKQKRNLIDENIPFGNNKEESYSEKENNKNRYWKR